MASTSLQKVSTAALKLIGSDSKKLSVDDIVRSELASAAEVARREATTPAKDRLPAAPSKDEFKITDEEQQALLDLVKLVNALPTLPDEVKEMTDEQREALTRVFVTEKTAQGVFKRVTDAIKTLVLNDRTVRLERQGVPEGAARDTNGWLIPVESEKLRASGVTGTLSIEKSSGPVVYSPAALRQLATEETAKKLAAEANGEEYTPLITHQEYLDMTVQTRVFDYDAALKAVRNRPELSLALAKIAQTKSGSIRLNKR